MGIADKTNVKLRQEKATPLAQAEVDGNFQEIRNVIDDVVQVDTDLGTYVLANDQRVTEVETDLSTKVKVFDTVADMKAIQGLVSGDLVETKGYHSVGDGGQARYLIKTSAEFGGTPDEYGNHTLSNGNMAVLQVEGAVNVKQFGAVGDGVVDDTAPLQVTINLVGLNGGGVIHIPTGTYLNDGVDCIYDNVHIKGDGKDLTTIVYTNPQGGGTVAAFNFGQEKTGQSLPTGANNCSIIGMTIDGNRDGGAQGSAVRTTTFDGFTAIDVHVKDCKANYGFAVIGGGLEPRNDIKILNCSAIRCGADGLDIKGGATRIHVDGFYSADHLNETTTGASVGVDIRGQHVSVNNVWVKDAVEIGIRVYIVSGVLKEGLSFSDDRATKDTQVALSNCFVQGCIDGYNLSAAENGTVSCSNIFAQDCTRFGFDIRGIGSVNVNGGSVLRCLTGVNCGPTTGSVITDTLNVTLSGVGIYENNQDGLVLSGSQPLSVLVNGGYFRNNSRYSLYLNNTSNETSVCANNVTLVGDNSGIGVLVTSGSNSKVIAQGCVFKDLSVGVSLSSGHNSNLIIQGGGFYSNSTNFSGANSRVKVKNATNIVSKVVLTDSIGVSTTGIKSAGGSHGLFRTPLIDEIDFRIQRVTNVNDYNIGVVRVSGITSSVASVQANVTQASATPEATASLITVIDLGV